MLQELKKRKKKKDIEQSGFIVMEMLEVSLLRNFIDLVANGMRDKMS